METGCRGVAVIRKNGHKTDANEPSDRVALLLAGGDGKRLRDLTSEIAGVPMPKQYCRLLQGVSLLEAAISRASLLFPMERIHVVINQDHLDLARDQVKQIPGSNIFIQPLNRDTGPGMVFSMLTLECARGDATVVVFPTDHYVDDNRSFVGHIARAMNAISYMPDKIALLGVVPDRPETGYGYVLPSNPLKISGNVYHVGAFMEKPNSDEASRAIERGGLWNTLVMVFRLSRMLELVRDIAPREFEELFDLRDAPNRVTELYQAMQPWNFSTRILSRIPQHMVVVKVANVSWSDWGTRESVERTCKSLNIVPSWELAKASGKRISQPSATEKQAAH